MDREWNTLLCGDSLINLNGDISMRSFKILLSVIVVMLIFGSCNQKPRGLWQEGVISVMADDEDWEAIQGALRSTYEKVVRTPQIEYRFKLFHVPDTLFDYYGKAQFLILASTLKSKGKTGAMVQQMLSNSTIRQQVDAGENFVFIRRNQWAHNQMMLVLVGKNQVQLRNKIEGHSIMLYDLIQNEVKKVLTKEVLHHRENRKLIQQLMDRYSWTMRLQKDYFLAEAFPEDNFLWMRRVLPDRWIFVRWVDHADTSLLNQNWVVSERNRIGKTYYHDFIERVADQFLFSRKTTFLGRPALITTGLWERVDDTAGGPFENYTFYDKPSDRVYMIDIALFAPGKDKMPYLRRMEIMVETFTTIFDES
jgi:hypothetical protein